MYKVSQSDTGAAFTAVDFKQMRNLMVNLRLDNTMVDWYNKKYGSMGPSLYGDWLKNETKPEEWRLFKMNFVSDMCKEAVEKIEKSKNKTYQFDTVKIEKVD